ncbi:MAG: 2-oxo acid dehydrogenase subunit E2 [Caldiserica bacterium]|nr:2-oxo acid dehydrogenase subunit E2 [Caldisericota bacterium]
MIKEIFMPQLGQTMEEGVISKWLKKEGDKVEKGEAVLEIATDKANLEVESFHRGYLRKILYPEGSTVPVTQTIALITDKPDEEIPEDYIKKVMKQVEKKEEKEVKEETKEERTEKKVEQPRTGKVKASPLAKKIAREKGVDLSRVQGTGPGGRITREDVLKYIETGGEEKEEIAFTRIREAVARKMVESKRDAPHFYLSIEVDMKKAGELKEKEGVPYSAVIIKALSLALKKHAWMRSTWENGALKERDSVDINIAIDTPEGLYAPVIKKADTKSIKEIAREVKSLSLKAKEGKLLPQELEIGVFTLSNLGMFGIDAFSAIIVPGQSGIMAVGEIKERVVVKDGMIGIRPIMKVVVSCDHRVVDGATGARFLHTFRKILEE